MGIFSKILDKLRNLGGKSEEAAPGQPAAGSGPATAQSGAQPQAALQNVDIDAVLSQLASKKGRRSLQHRWTLLKLLLSFRLDARKELAPGTVA